MKNKRENIKAFKENSKIKKLVVILKVNGS